MSKNYNRAKVKRLTRQVLKDFLDEKTPKKPAPDDSKGFGDEHFDPFNTFPNENDDKPKQPKTGNL